MRERVPAEKSLTWFLDPDTEPADIESRLVELGLRKTSNGGYLVHALVCMQEPPEVAGPIAIREVQTPEDWPC